MLVGQSVSTVTAQFQLDTTMCNIFDLHESPNGRWIAIDVSCEASFHTILLEVSTGQMYPAGPNPWQDSAFLNWVSDDDSFLLRVGHLGEGDVLLMDAKDRQFERIDVPPFTYDAAFSPDGQRVLYALTRGLGFGSEVWIMKRDGSDKEQVTCDPTRIIVYPRWSPTGDAITYIRIPDSNVPFTVGELVLTDAKGHDAQIIAQADAGHGYPPVWSPDGTQIAFVVRENPEDNTADVAASHLESNIYLADVLSGNTRAVTQFEGALTDGPTWSPDGGWLAFSTNASGVADVWLVEVATGKIRQITHDAEARHPVWMLGQGE